ncbi:hypothetical protein [Nonomuraea sp. NPDC049028]|uniref:hypothetical protein n=1 Tax=Nonomuraea sp. NPDC049028 TaxID=3364348 RepID=UPI00371C08BC
MHDGMLAGRSVLGVHAGHVGENGQQVGPDLLGEERSAASTRTWVMSAATWVSGRRRPTLRASQ